MTANGWTCFHCGDHFPATVEGRAEARAHFGPTLDIPAECQDRRTTAHADAVRRMRQAQWEARQALENTIGIEEHFGDLRAHVAQALRRMNVATLEEAIDQLETLRLRLQDADVFSRVVHRLRPTVWSVAMVDAYGPGEYFPPAEPRPQAVRTPTLTFPPGTVFEVMARPEAPAS